LVDQIWRGENPKVLSLLIKHGAPVDTEDGKPLRVAVQNYPKTNFIGTLLENGAWTEAAEREALREA
jgi:hypothetical protein